MNALGALSLLPPNISTYFPHNAAFVHYGTHGDGSCFFHSMSAALNKHDYLRQNEETRQKIGLAFRRNFVNSLDTLDTSLQTREDAIAYFNSNEWADERTVSFVSKVLKLNILFISTITSKMYCNLYGDPYDPMILILWVREVHFEPIGLCRDLKDGETGVQFQFNPNDDGDVIDHVLGAFKAQCPEANV